MCSLMRSILNLFVIWASLFWGAFAFSETSEISATQNQDTVNEQRVDSLKEPLYNPFLERYVLDELKQIRQDLAAHKVETTKAVVDRDLAIGDKAMSYATNTVTYFFYLIAAVSSILVIVGWTSIRDIRDKVHSVADKEVQALVSTYEKRLRTLEQQLMQKTQHIDENREEIKHTQEVHALWLRAQQEHSAANKIVMYDEILALRPSDSEALTYKADAILELGEPNWAKELCIQALAIDANYGYAHYQMACVSVALGMFDDAIASLNKAIGLSESFIDEAAKDPALKPLSELPEFRQLLTKAPALSAVKTDSNSAL